MIAFSLLDAASDVNTLSRAIRRTSNNNCEKDMQFMSRSDRYANDQEVRIHHNRLFTTLSDLNPVSHAASSCQPARAYQKGSDRTSD